MRRGRSILEPLLAITLGIASAVYVVVPEAEWPQPMRRLFGAGPAVPSARQPAVPAVEGKVTASEPRRTPAAMPPPER